MNELLVLLESTLQFHQINIESFVKTEELEVVYFRELMAGQFFSPKVPTRVTGVSLMGVVTVLALIWLIWFLSRILLSMFLIAEVILLTL